MESLRRVRTFVAARCELDRLAPPPDAPAEERYTYHLRAAAVYRRIAETDHDRRNEALAYADVEEQIYAPQAHRPVGCSCRYAGEEGRVRRVAAAGCTVHTDS